MSEIKVHYDAEVVTASLQSLKTLSANLSSREVLSGSPEDLLHQSSGTTKTTTVSCYQELSELPKELKMLIDRTVFLLENIESHFMEADRA